MWYRYRSNVKFTLLPRRKQAMTSHHCRRLLATTVDWHGWLRKDKLVTGEDDWSSNHSANGWELLNFVSTDRIGILRPQSSQNPNCWQYLFQTRQQIDQTKVHARRARRWKIPKIPLTVHGPASTTTRKRATKLDQTTIYASIGLWCMHPLILCPLEIEKKAAEHSVQANTHDYLRRMCVIKMHTRNNSGLTKLAHSSREQGESKTMRWMHSHSRAGV